MPNAPHLLVAALAVLLCAGAPAKPAYRSLEWDGTKDADPKSYTREGLTVTVASRPQTEDGVVPIALTIASPRFGRTTFTSTNSAVRQAAVLVAPLDPKADGPVVALQVFTGGAHCCTQIDILEHIDGAWKHVDAGQWDGDFGLNAVDFDGDGVPDIELHDDAFDYAFACYACGSPPPRIFDLEGGVWTDVSAAPRFAPVFRAAAAEMKKGCGPADGGGQNGPMRHLCGRGRPRRRFSARLGLHAGPLRPEGRLGLADRLPRRPHRRPQLPQIRGGQVQDLSRRAEELSGGRRLRDGRRGRRGAHQAALSLCSETV